jgi:hypothetical protein
LALISVTPSFGATTCFLKQILPAPVTIFLAQICAGSFVQVLLEMEYRLAYFRR